MLAIPPGLLNLLGLQRGAEVGLTIQDGRLVVSPLLRPRYSLEELLAGCKPRRKRTRLEREWLTGQPAGKELI